MEYELPPPPTPEDFEMLSYWRNQVEATRKAHEYALGHYTIKVAEIIEPHIRTPDGNT